MTALTDLPSMPDTAAPVILPGLLAGVGVTPPRIPRWITDRDLIDSILAGLMDLPDELNPQEQP
ncbi:MAG: hypothetical protein LBV78_24270 [Kitasatospora sp.]|nr:hypothetical protein [Kitasatospora sp.]